MDQDNIQQADDSIVKLGRRQVLKGIGLVGSALVLGKIAGIAPVFAQTGKELPKKDLGGIPHRPLGRTGVTVPILALGGGHLIRTSEEEGTRIVHEAIEAGLTFFDNAWDYHQNRSEEVMGKALHGKRQHVFLMTKMCTHGRGKDIGLLHLEQSLRRLGTDYLDLWQIHEVGCQDDPDLIFRPGGAAEALLQAKRQGKVRFIGFTGHKDPAVHLNILKHDFPFDTCQLPLNVFDASYQSFERQVLPELTRRGIAPLGMKSLCGKGEPIKNGVVTVEEAIRYVLSLPIATLVSGIDSREVLRQNVAIVRRFVPMTAQEMDALRIRVASGATDGRFETYKTDRLWSCDRPEVEKQFGPLERV
jgi:predicted aldo/keto reductase-like oxidoreductase